MSNLWRCLEDVHSLVAVPLTWRGELAGDFDVVKAAFLRGRTGRAKSFPCSNGCGCAHEVIEHKDGMLVGVCRCEPWNCDDIPLSREDVVLLELNWQKFGRVIAKAFGCDAKHADLGLARTIQVGAFSGAALPVVLTIQHEPEDFRNVVGQVVGRLREHFVLLAPTSRFHDLHTHAMLKSADAGFFDLESHLKLLPNGGLLAKKSAGELFSPFLPEQETMASEETAIQVFAIRKKLRSQGKRRKKAPIGEVFDLLVLEGQTQEFVAGEYDCSPGLISMRVDEIEGIMKRTLPELKALAGRLREMDGEDKDPRARKRYRKG